MGNQSVLRVKSGNMEYQTDFRTQKTRFGRSSTNVSGTLFALVLIDKDFDMKNKASVSEFIDRALADREIIQP